MDTKSLFASKTFWGVVVMAIGFGLGFFGYTVSADDQAQLTDKLPAFVSAATEFVGFILALYGRIKATKPATVLPK